MAAKRVLIVDDEEPILNMMVDVLGLLGYEAVGSRSGENALAVCAEQDFDLVISDVVMPGLSGTELLCQLRQTHPELPVIMIAAFSTDENADTLKNLGAAAYLGKPFEIGAIEPLLKALIGPGEAGQR